MNSQPLTPQPDELFQILVEESSQGIYLVDALGQFIFANPTFCQMTGYSHQELLTLNFADIQAAQQTFYAFDQSIKHQDTPYAPSILLRKDGSIFQSEIIRNNIHFKEKDCVLGTVQKISERLITQQELISSKQRYHLAMQITNNGIWDWDIQTNQVTFDECYYTMAGYQKDAFANTFAEWKKRIHPEDMKHALNAIELYIHNKADNYDVEFRFLRFDNSYMWIRSRGTIVNRDKNDKPLRFIGIHSDISVQKKHEEKILHQAHFDSLTLLPNRFLSLDRLKHACQEAHRNNELVALIFLDLDDFKKVNDTLGHETGDFLLKEAAKRLCGVVREVDTVGRLGGDEFIIILGSLSSAQESHHIVESLLSQFREMFVINGRELMLTASVGIAMYPSDAQNASELLRNADSAMYDAKSCGRNTYSYFTAKMNQCAQRRLAIEEQIHGALSRNEFTIFYQAKTDLLNSKVMGAEALLRWKNPTLGDVPPDEFISIAEQTGIIISLGKFILEKSLEQTALWHKKFNDDFEIAVNLSPRQFRDPQLVDFIEQTLKKVGVNASKLELEITEGVLLSGHSHIEKMLSSITSLGVKMAMDDFGTGYSSLSYLRTYPFDIIKIDRSFINEITTTKKDKALINAVISMSHALNLKVVAEGIETEQQCKHLQLLGCDYGQGFLFSKPVSSDGMTKLLANSFKDQKNHHNGLNKHHN